VPQLKDAKDLSKWKGLWNKQAGWAHAANALRLVATEVSIDTSDYSNKD